MNFEQLVCNLPLAFFSNLIAATLYSSVSSSSLKLILVSVLACVKNHDIRVDFRLGLLWQFSVFVSDQRGSRPEFLWCLTPVFRSQYPHCLSESSPAFIEQSIRPLWQFLKAIMVKMCYAKTDLQDDMSWSDMRSFVRPLFIFLQKQVQTNPSHS